MGFVLSPEVWGFGLVASGYCGWVFGNLQGSAGAVTDGNADAEDIDEPFLLTAPPKVAATSASELPHPLSKRSMGQSERPAAAIFQSDSAEQSCADTPPLSEVRAQVQLILQNDNVWEASDSGDRLAEFMRTGDPRSVNLLSQYRSSIEVLQGQSTAVTRGNTPRLTGSGSAS